MAEQLEQGALPSVEPAAARPGALMRAPYPSNSASSKRLLLCATQGNDLEQTINKLGLQDRKPSQSACLRIDH